MTEGTIGILNGDIGAYINESTLWLEFVLQDRCFVKSHSFFLMQPVFPHSFKMQYYLLLYYFGVCFMLAGKNALI